MKKVHVVAALVVLCAASFVRAQDAIPLASAKTTVTVVGMPSLPAYDKKPYFKGDEILEARQRLHPERKPQNAVLYGTPDLTNSVYVYLTKEGANQYAAWYTRTAVDAPTFLVRGYNWTDGKWVFETEQEFPNE